MIEKTPLKEKKPIIHSFGKYESGFFSFVNYWGEISFEVDEMIAEKINSICFKCTGTNSVAEIIKSFNKDEEVELLEIFELLFDNKVIFDSREFYKIFHEASESPSRYTYSFSDDEINSFKAKCRSIVHPEGELISLRTVSNTLFTDLVLNRKSIRNFSGASITDQELSDLLILSYSTNRHKSTPSGGGFYPLRVYFLLRLKTESLSPGLYFYNHEKSCIVKVSELPLLKDEYFEVVLGAPMYNSSSVVIFVGCDFNLVTKKYANRAYRMALLEAGHLCQNVYLCTSKTELGVVEYGGWNDEVLEFLLDIKDKNILILSTLFIGHKQENSSSENKTFEDIEEKLRSSICLKDSGIVRFFETELFHFNNYIMPGYASVARYVRDRDLDKRNPKLYSAFGFAKTISESRVKAIAEAFERYVSGRYRVDEIVIPNNAKEKFFNILENTHQDILYMKENNLSIIDYTKKCSVVWASYLLDSNKNDYCYVPVDHVFYPISKKDVLHDISFHSNSTGVAAHTHYETAVKKALFELVERDAVAVMWFSKISPKKIDTKSLPEDLFLRVEALQKIGREVVFFDITTDSVPVILCLCYGDFFPMTTSGCSAQEDPVEACRKALDEAEFIFNSWKRVKREKKEYFEVKSATDHGDLFAWTNLKEDHNLKWLLEGRVIPMPAAKQDVYSSLLKTHNPVVVLLSMKHEPLFVVRVLSKTLYPFTFGYGSEFYGHQRLKMLGLKWGQNYPSFPHLIA